MVIWSYKMSFPDYLALTWLALVIILMQSTVHVLLFKKHKTSIY